MNFRKHSNQTELDQFFKVIKDENKPCQSVTKSAFCQARKQLSYTAFIELNRKLVDNVYQSKESLKKWHGFRLCAVDGTSIRLPDSPEIKQHFGVHKGRPEHTSCTMGMASVFYDVLNHIAIDSGIFPTRKSEHLCAEEHLQFADKNDLIIYDRGYTAFYLYAIHLQKKINFCIRARTSKELVIKNFIASGKKDAIVEFTPNKPSIKTCTEKGLSTKPIKLRLVRVNLKNQVEVLITNLLDQKQYRTSIFKGLYHLRWGIEENYKRLKQWVEIENFSGKSVLSIKQDFYAKIVATNLTALVGLAAQEKVEKTTKHRRLKYQINFAQALSKMKHQIVRLLRHGYKDILLIRQLINYLSQTVEAVRNGRSYKRKLKNIKNDIHFAAYKSAL